MYLVLRSRYYTNTNSHQAHHSSGDDSNSDDDEEDEKAQPMEDVTVDDSLRKVNLLTFVLNIYRL